MATASADSLLDSALSEVRRIVFEGLGPAKARVFLFGSRASGRARANSDIDVAILPLETFEPGTLARIRESLEESRVPWRVDIVDLGTASTELRAAVEREGIPWTA